MSLGTLAFTHVAVVKRIKVSGTAVIHHHLPDLCRDVHLLPLSKPRRIFKLATVQRLLDATHNICQRLAFSLAQLDGIVVILHDMSITIVGDTCIGLIGHNNTDRILLTVHIKIGCCSIVVADTDGHNLVWGTERSV